MTYIKLTHGGTEYVVRATSITVGGQANTSNNPTANGTEVAEVQTLSFSNPIYNIQGVHFTGVAGTLTYVALLNMLKHKYTGSNAITLQVQYGDSTNLVASDGTTTSIPVVIKNFSFPIKTSDTKDGYMPVASIQLLETK